MDKLNLGDLVEIGVDDGHDKVSCEGGIGYKLEPRSRIKKIGLIVAWDQYTKDWVKIKAIKVGSDEFHMRHVGQIRKIQ